MTFPWLFHDQFKFSMTQKCWKPSLLGAYFCSVTRRIFPVFKQHEIFGPKKWNSMTFPWSQPFSLKSMTFPGLENAFSNSMTFHDFSWPYEPCLHYNYIHSIVTYMCFSVFQNVSLNRLFLDFPDSEGQNYTVWT